MGKKPCYYCGTPTEDGYEHVPPRGIFPGKSETADGLRDFLVNLITVPSCDQHNQKVTRADQIFIALEASAQSKNSHGVALETSSRLESTIEQMGKSAVFDEVYVMNDAGEINHFRLVNYAAQREVLNKIGRGLYCHDAKQKEIFAGEVLPISLSHVRPDGKVHPSTETVITKILPELESSPFIGGNPEIFAYQRTDIASAKTAPFTIYMLWFYGEPRWVLLMRHA